MTPTRKLLAVMVASVLLSVHGADQRGKEFMVGRKVQFMPDWRRIDGTNYNVSVLREWHAKGGSPVGDRPGSISLGQQPLLAWKIVVVVQEIEAHKLGTICQAALYSMRSSPVLLRRPVFDPNARGERKGFAMFRGTMLWRGQQIPVYDSGELITEAEASRTIPKAEKPTAAGKESKTK